MNGETSDERSYPDAREGSLLTPESDRSREPSVSDETARDDAMSVEVIGADVPPDDVRGRLLSQFERWVDRMLVGEPPPQGLPEELIAAVTGTSVGASKSDAEGDCDLYALFSALTTLSGEVRLQGRAFKQVADALSPLQDVSARLARLEDSQRTAIERADELSDEVRAATAEEPAPGPTGEEALDLLIDLYDRLERGLRTFDAVRFRVQPSPASLWQRFAGQRRRGGAASEGAASASDALREGYVLTLSRLEAALRQWDVQRIGAPGEMFDPARMIAVDVQTAPEARDGAVLEVYRSGYAIHGQVLSTARVKVARGGSSANA